MCISDAFRSAARLCRQYFAAFASAPVHCFTAARGSHAGTEADLCFAPSPVRLKCSLYHSVSFLFCRHALCHGITRALCGVASHDVSVENLVPRAGPGGPLPVCPIHLTVPLYLNTVSLSNGLYTENRDWYEDRDEKSQTFFVESLNQSRFSEVVGAIAK